LAAELVEGIQRPRRVRARWLACDEGYGQDPALLDRIAATGLWYLAEVPGLTRVWPLHDPVTGRECARPQLWVPPTPAGRRGRSFTKERLQPDSPPHVRVDTLVPLIPDQAWRRYRIVEGSKGPLVADFAALRVVTTRHSLPGPEVWVLLRRAVADPTTDADEKPEVKIYLSNASADLPVSALVRVSGMRWPIESCVAEGKGDVGLDHYEVRSWQGWHHHMTLVILAHHFLVRMQQRLSQRGGPAERPAYLDPPVCLDPPVARHCLHAAPIVLSLTQVRLLLRAVLPLPTLDIVAALDLVSYQQQRKAAAYCSHRMRLLRRLGLLPP